MHQSCSFGILEFGFCVYPSHDGTLQTLVSSLQDPRKDEWNYLHLTSVSMEQELTHPLPAERHQSGTIPEHLAGNLY